MISIMITNVLIFFQFRMLKAYIHVRMQLEKPSLLNVALVGVFVPSLSGRLKRYNILF